MECGSSEERFNVVEQGKGHIGLSPLPKSSKDDVPGVSSVLHMPLLPRRGVRTQDRSLRGEVHGVHVLSSHSGRIRSKCVSAGSGQRVQVLREGAGLLLL